MTITKRRMQFLHHLVDLYQKTRLPIHYEALAKSLGVSKWTAYDMVKEIEKMGLISRSYEVNTGETGRSQVVFAPTAKAWDLLKQARAERVDLTGWKQTVGHITGLLKERKPNSLQDAIRQMLGELSEGGTRIRFCAYMIGLMAIYLKELGGKPDTLIRRLVEKAPTKESGLTLFVGTVWGSVVHTMNDDLGLEMTELLSEFIQTIAGLTHAEQELLSDFLNEAFIL